ncbi:hypothetical protein ACKVMT_00180 [Halobacteriales archaeon Cl-PHB]
MSEIPAQIRDLLGTDETLVTVASATRADSRDDEAVTVGLTDRRLVTVAADGGFLDLRYDAIHSIRSRQRESVAYDGIDYRALALLGGGAVVAAVVGSLAVAANSGPGIVAFLTLGGFAALVAGHRDAVDERAVRRSTRDWLASAVEDDRLERYERRLGRHLEVHEVLVAGSALVTLLALGGLFVVTASALVVVFGLLAVGGVWLVDYAIRHRDAFDGFHVARQAQREVVVHTADGRTVRLRLDGDSPFDRELSRLTSDGRPRPGTPPVETVGN